MSNVPAPSGGKMPVQLRASNMFKGMREAKARVQANYMKEGIYLCRYDAVKCDATRKNEDFLVFEMTVVKVIDNNNGAGHKLGESVSHMLLAKNDSFLPNVKRILANVLNMMPEQITEENAIQVCMPDQPLAGMVVEIKARGITTKAGKPFTEIDHKREVPASELLQVLDANAQSLFFPNNALQKLAEAEAAARAAVPQVAAPAA